MRLRLPATQPSSGAERRPFLVRISLHGPCAGLWAPGSPHAQLQEPTQLTRGPLGAQPPGCPPQEGLDVQRGAARREVSSPVSDEGDRPKLPDYPRWAGRGPRSPAQGQKQSPTLPRPPRLAWRMATHTSISDGPTPAWLEGASPLIGQCSMGLVGAFLLIGQRSTGLVGASPLIGHWHALPAGDCSTHYLPLCASLDTITGAGV